MNIDTVTEFRSCLEGVFRKFYEDKYTQKECEEILDDLARFIAEEYIESIIFCAYEKSDDKVSTGYEIRFKYQYSGRGRSIITQIDPKNFPKTSEVTEKLLIIKPSRSFLQLTADKQREFLSELTGPWDYCGELDMKAVKHKNYFQTTGLEVQIGEIDAEVDH